MVVIFIGSSIPGANLPELAILTPDKLFHITIFLVLGLLVHRALQSGERKDSFSWPLVWKTLAIVIAYGVADEFHQSFVPGRTLDVWDAAADGIGGILAELILYAFWRWRKSEPMLQR